MMEVCMATLMVTIVATIAIIINTCIAEMSIQQHSDNVSNNNICAAKK